MQPFIGKGATPYAGQLPGTYGLSGIQKQLVGGAETGTGPFAAYANIANPEEWKKRTAERAETRESWLAPRRQKEDALLKEKMANMGLTYSSDVVKAGMDVAQTREAEDATFRQGIYDQYEKMGIEAAPELIQLTAQVGEMDRSIQEAGLGAEFQEWLRTQPEYSPYIDMMFRILGLQPKMDADTSTTAWGVSGGAKGQYTSPPPKPAWAV
jgi:hypothetical protein